MVVPRPLAVSVALLMSVSILAGCLGDDDRERSAGHAVPVIDVSRIVALDATITEMERGVISVVWEGPLDVPNGFHITIPEGATYVEATRHMSTDDATTYLRMVNAATGRIRCQPETFEAYFVRALGSISCSGLTVLEPLPAVWKTQDFRRIQQDELGRVTNDGLDLRDGESLEIILRSGPLDGPAAMIELSQLSMPQHDELPTDILTIAASADGEPLWLEVTRPDMDGPVPTIIVSSPYNHGTREAGARPQNSTIADWVPRGYAVVSADVRGFGESGGCVEVWGPNEQQDQYDIVEWVADQPWSDGKIGFYGQSYVGTTPVEAASLGAPALDAIIAVAPVINAYNDWHFGGVPNGEHVLSPIAAYQVLGTEALFDQGDPLTSAMNVGNGFCDPTLGARSSDPRGVYDEFYRERDFSKMASNVKAAVLYTQGYYDENVKSAMVLDWFNDLDVPKKGIFGDWVHQHPARADQELYFHAWFDEFLKDRTTGILETPVVEMRTNMDTVRYDEAWPSARTTTRTLGLDLGTGAELVDGEGAGERDYLAYPAHVIDPSDLPTGLTPRADVVLRGERLDERLYITGVPEVRLKASLGGADNTFFYALLEEIDEHGKSNTVTYGMLNAALRNGYETYEPVPPAETILYQVPMLPTEYVVPAGHELRLTLRSADIDDWALVQPTEPGIVTLYGDGDDGSALLLPVLDDPGDMVAPRTAGPASGEAGALSGLP